VSTAEDLQRQTQSAFTVLERLKKEVSQLDPASDVTKEHVLESGHPKMENAEQNFQKKFAELVDHMSITWGQPKSGLPPSSKRKAGDILSRTHGETTASAGEMEPSPEDAHPNRTLLRSCYWEHDGSYESVLLCKQPEKAGDSGLYYCIVLGCKPRRQAVHSSMKVESLRNTKEHWMSGVIVMVKDFFRI